VKYTTEYVTCVICKRKVWGHVPKGGDGSALFPYKHKMTMSVLGWDGKPRKEICPGSMLACLEDTPDWKKYDIFAREDENIS
jgi:hypothetical protein